jgi:hypothetical protein
VAGTAVDLAAVNGGIASDAGVEHGKELLAFTEAVMGEDDAALAHERASLRAVLSPGCFVEVVGIIAGFNVVDRIADATGIPLDSALQAMAGDLRRDLDLGRFASSANSPKAVDAPGSG